MPKAIVETDQLDSDLYLIANAIKEKLGYDIGSPNTLPTYLFPQDFISAINTIGDAELETFYSVIGRTGTELRTNASRFGNGAFYNWTKLTKAVLPLGQMFLGYSFRACTGLTTVDIGDPTRTDIYTTSNSEDLYFATNSFNGSSALSTLILRPNIVAKLQATGAFTSTPINSGTGYIYVPSALVDSYKSATNWSSYADQIRAIEDYPEITGGAV